MAGIDIRPATEADMPHIAHINRHYVANTVITLNTEPRPLELFIDQLRQIRADGLPYLVAADAESPGSVLGYANAHGFRARSGGYLHTAEVTLFCDHHHTGRGIGSALLAALIDVLRDPSSRPELLPSPPPTPRPVSQLIAVMAVDEGGGKRGGLALKEFYEKFGFTCNGHLRRVGYKHGKWVDTMYLQLSL